MHHREARDKSCKLCIVHDLVGEVVELGQGAHQRVVAEVKLNVVIVGVRHAENARKPCQGIVAEIGNSAATPGKDATTGHSDQGAHTGTHGHTVVRGARTRGCPCSQTRWALCLSVRCSVVRCTCSLSHNTSHDSVVKPTRTQHVCARRCTRTSCGPGSLATLEWCR